MIDRLETRYGPMYVPDTDEGQYWWLAATGAYAEDNFIELICTMLDERPKGIALDVGSNFGCWSLPLARHATQVIAFEPQRCVLECFLQTLAANRHLNILLYPFAVGPEAGAILCPDIDINNTANFGGFAMGEKHPEHPDAPMYKVPVVTIDSFVFDEPISFIKADIEGAELGFLQGAEQTIRTHKPIMFIEAIHPGGDPNVLGKFIEGLGYNIEMRLGNFLCMPL